MRRCASLAAALAGLGALLAGCMEPPGLGGGPDSRAWDVEAAKSFLVAIDTSESAGDLHSAMGGRQKEHLVSLPMSATLRVYRFDSSPAEVHDGPPPGRDTEAATLLKSVYAHRSKTTGTNMARLIDLLDQHLGEVPTPAEVTLYTDAGIEEMTEAEKTRVREVTARWATDERLLGVRIVGLRDGWREPIRDLFRLPPAKLVLDGRSAPTP